MSKIVLPPLPDTRIEIVIEWFERCRDGARKMGKIDSAMLWDDGCAIGNLRRQDLRTFFLLVAEALERP